MATKLTLMEMRFSKSLTNTTCRATKSSSLALIRSLRMNASRERWCYEWRMPEFWWFLERDDLPKSPPPDGKVIMWVCRRHFDFQKKLQPFPSSREKKICPPLPVSPPRYQEEMHGDSTVLWNLTKKKTIMYIGPNWRVSDSPRKNEDKTPLKFEKTFFIPKDFKKKHFSI